MKDLRKKPLMPSENKHPISDGYEGNKVMNGHRTMPSDMVDAAKSAYEGVEKIVDSLNISNGDKDKAKLAIRHNIQRRQQQMVADINELQRRTKLAVPETVGKELLTAIETQVRDYYKNNRADFVNGITKAFATVGKSDEVKAVLEKELFEKEDQLIDEVQKKAPAYVKNMHQRYVNESHNQFHQVFPDFSPKNALLNIKRFWKSDHFAHQWHLDVEEKKKRDTEVELSLGAAIANDYFGFHLKAPTGAAMPQLDRGWNDTFRQLVLSGNLKDGLGDRAQGALSRPIASLLTFANPLYWASSFIGWAAFYGIDKSQLCFKPEYEITATTAFVTMPAYYNWPPNNMWPFNYPQKAYKRLYQQVAASGKKPTHYTELPKQYRKMLVLWGIANCLFTAEDIGLPADHPWCKESEQERRKVSRDIGRAEHIDYTLKRDLKMRDIPEIPAENTDSNIAAKIKGKQASNEAANIRGYHPEEQNKKAARINTPEQRPKDALTIKTNANKPADDNVNLSIKGKLTNPSA